MAGLMMFDNADTFKKGYANGLAGLAYNSQGAERESALGKLANVDAGYAQELKSSYEKQDYSDLIDAAGILRAVRGTPQEGQAWASLKPRIEQKYGFQLPEMPNESVWGVIDQIKAAQGGGGQRVHSQYMGADGKMRVIMSDGTEKEMGAYNPKFKMNVDAFGNVTGYNSVDNSLAPTAAAPIGGNTQPKQEPKMTEADLTTYLNALNVKGEELVAGGADRAQVNAWMEEQVASLPKEFAANPTQAKVGVKDEAPKSDGAPSGYRFQTDGSLAFIPGGPADPATNPQSQKPLPKWAVDKYDDILGAQTAGANAMEKAAKHLQRIGRGELTVSPVAAGVGAIRRGTGFGNAQDANLAELKADLTEIVNDSLRLNKGVQTEGDSQRAYKAVMDSNDNETLVRALTRLIEVNKKGIELQKARRALVDKSLNKGPAQTQAPSAPSGGGWSYGGVK